MAFKCSTAVVAAIWLGARGLVCVRCPHAQSARAVRTRDAARAGVSLLLPPPTCRRRHVPGNECAGLCMETGQGRGQRDRHLHHIHGRPRDVAHREGGALGYFTSTPGQPCPLVPLSPAAHRPLTPPLPPSTCAPGVHHAHHCPGRRRHERLSVHQGPRADRICCQ